MLEFKNISKSFFKNKVLDGISFKAESGEILALAGQNGAGKSTLMKILTGIYQADGGQILIDGKEVHFTSVSDADAAGVGIVYQELSVIPHLTVAENVVLSQNVNRRFHYLDKKKEIAQTEEVFRRLGVEIDVTRPLGEYTASTQQLVEIAKSIYKNPKLVVFDEPTTSLTNKEREKLFEVMDAMRKEGMTILFITHYLEEMYRMADKCVVLRDGRVQYYGAMNQLDKGELVNLMIGQRLDAFYPKIESYVTEKTAVELSGFGGGIVAPCDLKINYGEVVGLAGLVGAGRTELVWMLIGHTKHSYGSIKIDDRDVTIKDPGDALDLGIAYINEDRKNGGLHTGMGIGFNMLLPSIVKNREDIVSPTGYINDKEAGRVSDEMIAALEVKCVDADQKVMTLSGGNQQKVSIAKWIAADPQIYIFDEPTKGIDVLTKSRVYDIIRGLAKDGKAVLVISSYTPELIGVCDRVEVMSKGKIVASFGQGVTENDILLVQ